MENKEDLEKAREFFYKDIYAAETTGCVLEEVGESYAKCTLELSGKHRNGYGAVMGGAIFTLADFTFAVASNFNKTPTVSVTSQISFLSSSKGTKLIAESKLVKDGRTTCFYEVNVVDDLGKPIALVTFTGAKLS